MSETFTVWAPDASVVELVHGDGGATATVPMQSDSRGWWTARVGEPVSDYGFRVDGAGPFPDPRSRWQPNGVHGLSRRFDPAAYRWEHDDWTGRQLAGSVIYELHVGTFTPEGTLDAAAARLDHLVDLGVGFIELLPVNAFNGPRNWGYDGVLWYAVHDGYGGPAAYQRFVDACHDRGIGVIQDVVYNHLGPSGNHLPRFGPYLSDGSANTWGASVNLDGPGSDEVRRYIIENALMWLRDYRVDGLRLDAVHALADSRATHILEELSTEVDALSASTGRPLSLIAESDLNDPKLVTPVQAGGFGLHAQWSDDFHHAVHVALTGETDGYYADFEPLSALKKVLERGFFHDGSYSSFRGRHHGRPIDTERMPAWRLVVASQNHDQIGNRAVGDRLSAILDDGQLAIAATLTLLGPFTPMLFMGEEWGAGTPWQFFTSHPEPELGEATAKGRIEEFARMGWDPAVVPDPQDPATFERSVLRWGELDQPAQARLLEFYRALTTIRRESADASDPRFSHTSVEVNETDRWLALYRGGLTVLANFGEHDVRLAAPAGEVILAFPVEPEPPVKSTMVMPAHSVIVASGG
ncbi:MAG TPA: malto-oligosyltrehalose trehalohydrolase [Homoserinimonas sp.]|nr:malto-oligosyltrehalose trehalohydrolase [Homoserinimonas sp.]